MEKIGIYQGVSYTDRELKIIKNLQKMSDSPIRKSLIERFESLTRKKFPEIEPVTLSFNPDAANLSSADTKQGLAFIARYPQLCRK